ncbi:MAG TPA: hypothetical protein VHK88_06165 [Aquihabitans sp.]|nr:hypothetical protein [Aquihabitans sp.]
MSRRDRIGGGRAGLPRRSAVALGVLAAALLGPAAPAAADPARPTDYRSRILSVRPALPAGVDLAVVGGDAFLDLRVTGDHTVVVPDYESGDDGRTRPYLRFRPDGTVERNERSAAAAANDDRYGSSAGATVGDDPEWQVVASGGRYAWHDHRIHWMLPREPRAVDDAGRVDLGGPNGTWSVPLEVDGRPTVVRGELLLLDGPSPVPWAALGLLAGVGLLVAGVVAVRRRGRAPHAAVALALGGIGVLAALVGWAEWRAIPPGAGGNVLGAVVPAVGAVAALVAATARRARVRLVALAVAVATLAAWAVLRREVVARAVLPTSLPYALDRATTALALGLAVGAGALLAWHPPVDGVQSQPERRNRRNRNSTTATIEPSASG